MEGLKSFNLVFASHECACVDVLPELAVAAGLVRREPLGRGLGRRCEVDCLLHVNFLTKYLTSFEIKPLFVFTVGHAHGFVFGTSGFFY